jgi:hypothetical protein
MSTSLADVGRQIDALGETAVRIKRERDQYRDALEDILLGVHLMQQPAVNLTGAFARYVGEVKRVAEEALK